MLTRLRLQESPARRNQKNHHPEAPGKTKLRKPMQSATGLFLQHDKSGFWACPHCSNTELVQDMKERAWPQQSNADLPRPRVVDARLVLAEHRGTLFL